MYWAEGRVHGEYDAIKTPVGFLPKYEDLKTLFKETFNREYTKKEYAEQFSLRIGKILAKLDRMKALLESEPNLPGFIWDVLNRQKIELTTLREKFGRDLISPLEI